MTQRSQNSFELSNLKLDAKNASVLGEAFWNLVRHYDIGREDQALLLGFRADSRGRLKRFENEGSIPIEYDVFYRVSTLLGIHKNLRILFPHNRELVYRWMGTPQPLLEGKSALEYIRAKPLESLQRMHAIRRLLDRVRNR